MFPLKLFYALEHCKAALIYSFGFADIVRLSLHRFYFLWLRWRGRGAEAEQYSDRMIGRWFKLAQNRFHIEVQVEGLENVPPKGPLIVMMNHQSLWDIPILVANLSRLPGFVAKKELFRLPAFSYWMKALRCIPLDRSNSAAAAKLFVKMSQHIKRTGGVVAIFPEGTRTRDPKGGMQKFREGSIRLASIAEIPILPISIDGTRFLSRGDCLYVTRKGGRLVRMKIAPTLSGSAKSAIERRELNALLHKTIADNLEQIRVQWPDKA